MRSDNESVGQAPRTFTERARRAQIVPGQDAGEFAAFATRPMAIVIRAAIDAGSGQVIADPDFGMDSYTEELVTLFERATRKERR